MSQYTWNGSASAAWATGGNWTPSGPPATSGDSATLDWNAILNGITGANESATTLAALNITSFFTLTVGSPGTPLQIGATLLTIGDASLNPGSGSGNINIALGSVSSTLTVYGSASSANPGLEAVRIKGTAIAAAYVLGGSVGFATDSPGDVATITTLDVGGNSTQCNLSAGVTWTTINQTGGELNINSGGTTINQGAGDLFINGASAITTLNVGGYVAINSTGTITNVIVLPGGTVDLSEIAEAITITNLTLYGGAKILLNSANPGLLTITNQIVLKAASTLLAA